MIPLDWYVNSNYRAEPTTVWQLGVVLYEVIHSVRFNTRSFVTKEQRICQWLTEGETNNCPQISQHLNTVLYHSVLLLWLYSLLLFEL